jgi:hypothetical protein
MRLLRTRFTVRRMMAAVAIAAVSVWAGLSLIGLAKTLPEWTFLNGAYTSILSAGDRVVITGDFRAANAREVIKPTGFTDYRSRMYKWSYPAPAGNYTVTAGTTGVVTIDPAWGEDCSYPDRPIAVELREGRWKGTIVALPRNRLRIQ